MPCLVPVLPDLVERLHNSLLLIRMLYTNRVFGRAWLISYYISIKRCRRTNTVVELTLDATQRNATQRHANKPVLCFASFVSGAGEEVHGRMHRGLPEREDAESKEADGRTVAGGQGGVDHGASK